MKSFGGALVGAHGRNVKQHEAAEIHVLGGRKSFQRGGNCDRRRVAHRIAVGPVEIAGNAKELRAMLVGHSHAFMMTTGQRFGLAMLAAAIDRTHGMDDVVGGSRPPG